MKKLGQSLDVDKIRRLRSERKWTQEQVAERLNISTSQYDSAGEGQGFTANGSAVSAGRAL